MLYHYTPEYNTDSIKEEGLLVGKTKDGLLYLADSLEMARQFACIYLPSGSKFTIFELDENRMEQYGVKIMESMDHDPNYFKGRAFYCEHDIPRECITQCHYYKIK